MDPVGLHGCKRGPSEVDSCEDACEMLLVQIRTLRKKLDLPIYHTPPVQAKRRKTEMTRSQIVGTWLQQVRQMQSTIGTPHEKKNQSRDKASPDTTPANGVHNECPEIVHFSNPTRFSSLVCALQMQVQRSPPQKQRSVSSANDAIRYCSYLNASLF